MRRFETIIVVLICLTFVFQFSAFAYEGTDADVVGDPSRYEPVCGNNAYHHMVYRCAGSAVLAGGSVYISSGHVWQCSNCYMLMVTEGKLNNNQMQTIGKWGTRNYSVPVYSISSVTVTSYGYCSSNSMSGFQFYSA